MLSSISLHALDMRCIGSNDYPVLTHPILSSLCFDCFSDIFQCRQSGDQKSSTDLPILKARHVELETRTPRCKHDRLTIHRCIPDLDRIVPPEVQVNYVEQRRTYAARLPVSSDANTYRQITARNMFQYIALYVSAAA